MIGRHGRGPAVMRPGHPLTELSCHVLQVVPETARYYSGADAGGHGDGERYQAGDGAIEEPLRTQVAETDAAAEVELRPERHLVLTRQQARIRCAGFQQNAHVIPPSRSLVRRPPRQT